MIRLKNILTIEQTIEMIRYTAKFMMNQEKTLTQIDQKIGDGDHGAGVYRGFSNLYEELENQSFSTINDVFRFTGMSLLKHMGGASGVLFCTLFQGGYKHCDQTETFTTEFAAGYFHWGYETIKERGRAAEGHKTILDALGPAVRSLQKDAQKGTPLHISLHHAQIAAREGVENTKQMLAQFGRARQYGEKALGYEDAGAMSIYFIFNALDEFCNLQS